MKKNRKVLAIILAVLMLLTNTAFAAKPSKSEHELPSRQEILDILLKSHPDGSQFSTPKPADMEKIQKWLRVTEPDKVYEEEGFITYHLACYQLSAEYNLTLTAKRTLVLSNKEGWSIETYNVDYGSMEIEATDFAVAKNGTYALVEGKLLWYVLGEETQISNVTITDTICIWNETDYQMVYVQDGNNLGIILSDGSFVNIASNYGYGIKTNSNEENAISFQYVSTQKKQEAIIIYEKGAEDGLLTNMSKWGIAISVETL